MRTAIIGDIGGQIGVFLDVIKDLGVDMETGQFPADLRVIQVGDIIRVHPSPDLDSLACAELANKLIDANNGKYIQLLGNHETPLLGGVSHPDWQETDLTTSAPIIESWWNERKAHIAVLLTKPGEKEILVTHAGLTRGYFERLSVDSVTDAVRLLNGYVGNVNLGGIERPGGLVTGVNDETADMFWALCGSELHESWWNNGRGFNQIHGHSCLYRWDANDYWHDVNENIKNATVVDKEERFTMTIHPNGDWYRSVDWVLGNTKQTHDWPVLVIDGYDIFTG